MTDKRKLITFLIIGAVIIASLVYGIFLGDPQDIRIEGSGL